MHSRLIAAAAAVCLPVSLATAQLTAVGATNPANGYPISYTDGQGTVLQPCLTNNGLCLIDAAVELLDPAQPFPLNYGGTFPEEFFYWAGQADLTTNAGGSALLVMAIEGAFANGPVAPGDQVVFARLRVRADNLVAGSTYHITTPYNEFDAVATGSGTRGINVTFDIGIDTPGVFTGPLDPASPIGPYLRWDTGLPIFDVAGNQYLGDPNVEHTVTGSPTGNNLFRIDGPNVGGPGINRVETNLFSVMGMLAGALPPGGGGGGGTGPVAPVANFTVSPASGFAPLSVTFTDASTNVPTAWVWDFGDGTSSTEQSPIHVYPLAGTYNVSLTATNAAGSNTRSSLGAVVVSLPPSVRIESVTPGTAGSRNTITVTGVTPNADVAVLWASAQGSAAQIVRSCNILADLASPQVLFRDRARNATTLRRDVNVGRNLRGVTMYLQAIDSGTCSKSPVWVELF